MKKTLLSALAVCGMLFSANAQSFTNGATGFLNDFTSASCLLNNLPSNGGIATLGGNITNSSAHTAITSTSKVLSLFSKATGPLTVATALSPAFYDFNFTDGANCDPMRQATAGVFGVDMSNVANGKITVIAQASAAGDLMIFLGSASSGSFPDNSTFNTGTNNASIIRTINVTTTLQKFTIDLTSDAAKYSGWAGSNLVNQVGFISLTPGVTFQISQIAVGSAATTITAPAGTVVEAVTNAAVLPSSVSYYPNPSNSVINVDNINVSTLKLMNLSGTVVKSVSSTSSISVEGLTPGMYFLQINEFKPVKVNVQ